MPIANDNTPDNKELTIPMLCNKIRSMTTKIDAVFNEDLLVDICECAELINLKYTTFKQTMNKLVDNLPDGITKEEYDTIIYYVEQAVRIYDEDTNNRS